jgi:hypothetical protein
LSSSQIAFLRLLARKTWAYFEAFVGPDDHWLPPDNFQEHPVAAIAHRTSPTNMGLALLANLSAYDLGYLATGELVERTGQALRTMATMERHRGHFYNWYDTQSLKPLSLYISSVDSGNLAAHMLTLRAGLLELPDARILSPRWLDGLEDTFEIVVHAAKDAHIPEIAQFRSELQGARRSAPHTLAASHRCLERLASRAAGISGMVAAAPDGGIELDVHTWALALSRQCSALLAEIALLAPWSIASALPVACVKLLSASAIPTLRELAALGAAMGQPTFDDGGQEDSARDKKVADDCRRLVLEASLRARDRISLLDGLAAQANEFSTMDYDFLFDRTRHLLAIGYNVAERRCDPSYYERPPGVRGEAG